ncbi:MAG: DUF2721 domain-containing protein [Candidatus Omnitrophica bacterium]|nr:DUF2721 domain-containing protein [Candidatus Omnitrophota bacterium]
MDISKAIQEIQYVLAPAIMVSSAALLMLGFQNKFSNLASRFRLLNQEKRQLSHKPNRTEQEQVRLGNLEDQVGHLFRRAAKVKNAILLTYGAIACFMGASILISLNIHSAWQLYYAIVTAFLTGLFFIFTASIIMISETRLFFHVIHLEKKS